MTTQISTEFAFKASDMGLTGAQTIELYTTAKREALREVREIEFKMDIAEYLPKVKAWQGGYDKSFNDGYAQAKKDIITHLESELNSGAESK